jgi:hypothetical protein
MTLSFNQRVAVPSTVLFRVVDDESVLLNLDSEIYFGLDDVGTRMWTELTSSASVQEAYDKLLASFDVTPEELKQDLVDLVGKLVEQGLLVITDG